MQRFDFVLSTQKIHILPDIVGHRKGGTTVQEDFDDLIVVFMSCQDQRSDIWCERSGVPVNLLPALEMSEKTIIVLSIKEYLISTGFWLFNLNNLTNPSLL